MPLRHGNFCRRVLLAALESAELPVIHFHGLRHTRNHLSAEAGATMRELMERMGHSTTRAALIYLHATEERQRAVADAVDAAACTALDRAKKGRQRAGKGRVTAGVTGCGALRRHLVSRYKSNRGPGIKRSYEGVRNCGQNCR